MYSCDNEAVRLAKVADFVRRRMLLESTISKLTDTIISINQLHTTEEAVFVINKLRIACIRAEATILEKEKQPIENNN